MMNKKNRLVISSLILSMTMGIAHEAFAQANKKKKKVVTTQTTRRVAPAAQASGKKTVGQLLSQISQDSRGANVQMKKGDTALPDFGYSFKPNQSTHNLESVKPPRSSEIMQNRGGGTKAEYERVLDQQIQELYKLTQRFKNSPNRGEVWLHLAELYVEKAGIVDARHQDAYDQALADFKTGKTKIKPVLNTAEAKDFTFGMF